MSYYLQGLILGLAYVAPIGAQNLFVINRALTERRGSAFLTALFIVFFDVSLAWICFFGIGSALERFRLLQLAVILAGGLVILWTGVALIRSGASEVKGKSESLTVWKTFIRACVVTWFNPQAVIDGTMLFGAFKASLPARDGLSFMLGVSTASFCWFNGLTLLLSFTGRYLGPKLLRVVNVVCGIVLCAYGLKLLSSGLALILNP